jgi:hypothetical protein
MPFIAICSARVLICFFLDFFLSWVDEALVKLDAELLFDDQFQGRLIPRLSRPMAIE